MRHTRRLIIITLGLFLLGSYIARESIIGFAARAEEIASFWLMGAAKEPGGIEGIILIEQEGKTNNRLSPIDTALFLRAASILKAKVAAIASSELAPGDASLLNSLLSDPFRLRCAVVGTCKLLTQGQSKGLVPAIIDNFPVAYPTLQSFSASDSMLPEAPGISGGFDNLPENHWSSPQFMTAAILNNQIVASLPLKIVLEEARMRGVTITATYENSWQFSNGSHLRFSRNALNTLNSENLERIIRISLDDLLLACERLEQNIPGSENISSIVHDRILILGALKEQPPQPVHFPNQKNLSQSEVIALAVANLQDSMLNRASHWSIQGTLILVLALLSALTTTMKPVDAVFALLSLFGFYVLMSMAIVSELSIIPPILAPAAILIATLLYRIVTSNRFKKLQT